MGGKSRKTGGISKTLIDKIKNGGKLPSASSKKSTGKKPKNELGLDIGG
jgi:hypothetical protein